MQKEKMNLAEILITIGMLTGIIPGILSSLLIGMAGSILM